MRVLVIEDNRDFAQILQHIFEVKGCTVEIAYSGTAGLERATEFLPDVIFCDIGLPGDINGLDLAQHCQKDQRLRHIPLVAVSGYTTEEDRQRALDAGFCLVLPKPVKFADLSSALSMFAAKAVSDDPNHPA